MFSLPWNMPLSFVTALLLAFVVYKVAAFLKPMLRAHLMMRAQDSRWPVVDLLTLAHIKRGRGMTAHRLGLEDAVTLGGVQVLRAGVFNAVQISDPWLLSELLNDQAKYPQKIDKPFQYPFNFYKGFDTTSDPLWKVVRKGVSPAFNPANLRDGFPKVVETLARLVKTLEREGATTPVDISLAMQAESFDVIGRVGFGRDFRAADDLQGKGAAACKAIKEGCKDVMGNFLNPLRRLDVFSKAAAERRKTELHILDTMRELLEEVEGRGLPSEEDKTIAAHLMRLGPLGKSNGHAAAALPHLRMWSELSISFLAGMETTGNTVSMCLFLISSHPEAEAKIVAELDAAGLLATPTRPHPRALTLQDLKGLTYLDCVLKECQRLKPIIPMVLRQAVEDVTAGPFTFPKGTVFLMHLMGMMQSPFYWERASEFWPERWLGERVEDAVELPVELLPPNPTNRPFFRGCESPECLERVGTTSVKRFLPFGGGPRKCIGAELAKMNYTAAVATMLCHFHFRLASQMGGVAGVEDTERANITLQHASGLFMHCEPRREAV